MIGMILSLFLLCSLHGQATRLTIKPTDIRQTITKNSDYTYTDDLLTVKTAIPVTISSNGIKTDHTIAVADGITATITLDNVNITKSGRSPFDILGDAKVSLSLVGVNELASTATSDNDYPALRCENKGGKTASLVIEGAGELRVTASAGGGVYYYVKGAVIGGGMNAAGGNITINSGIVTVTSPDNYGAGIGNGNGGGDGGNITISGGIVTVTCSGAMGAGIGGGISSSGGNIMISGGVVTVSSGNTGAAIGGGYGGSGGDITISGGFVIATSGGSGAGIGGGSNNTGSGSFKTTDKENNPGNAFIIASSIGDNSSGKKNSWSGVIFEGSNGKVYGSPTLPEGLLTIPSGKTLEVESDKTLTIGNKTMLINNGTITNKGTITNGGILAVKAGATLTNDGSYEGSGTLYKLGSPTLNGTNNLTSTAKEGILITFNGNDNNSNKDVSDLPPVQIIMKSTGHPVKPKATPLRSNYTCIGWSESNSDKTLITDDAWSSATSSADKIYYAVWKYNTKLAFTGADIDGYYSYTYAGSAPTVGATATGENSASLGDATCAFYSDITCNQSISTPTAAGTYYVQATHPGNETNMKVSMSTSYTIEQIALTVTPGIITKEYDGATTAVLPTFTLNSGVEAGDQSDVSVNTSGYSLAYASENVGSTISLTPTGTLSLSGDKSGNYKLTQPNGLTGAITVKELTVTPTDGQSIYKDEYPAYAVSGAVGAEKPAFTDHLGVNGGKVAIGGLALASDNTSGFTATNYSWKLSSSEVAITQDSKTLADAYTDEASSINGKVTADWYTEEVDLTPTSGFKIKGSSTLKSTDNDWKDQLTVDADGNNEVKYQLKRVGRVGDWDSKTKPSDEQTFTVKIDKTLPSVVVTPDSPDKLTLTVALSDATSGLASCTYDWNSEGDKTETLTVDKKSHSFTLTAPSAGDYPLKVVLTDQAGNETTYDKTVTLTEAEKPITPPVTPPDPVGPSEPEVTYTVTLPAVEGAATDPASGDYEVTSWSSFGFLLTLDAAYNQSAPIVTTDRGETIEPRVSDGKYIIKQVRSNVSVSISGIVKNPDPVANEKVSSPALRIYTAEGILCLDVPTATEAWLITADGRLLRSLTLSPGLNRVYGLRQGVYIVWLKDGTTRKVLIGK